MKTRFSPFLIIVSILVGCGPTLAAVPSLPSDDPQFAVALLDAKAGLEESEQAPADTVEPGDVLAFKVIGGTALDQPRVIVDRAGKIQLPLLGEIAIGGLTMPLALAKVQEVVSRYDRYGQASLFLVESQSRVASVTGAVERPGNIPLRGDARLVEVLAAAGGAKNSVSDDALVELGDLDGGRLVRRGKVLPVDLRKAMAGDLRHNVRVLPGDVIAIPPRMTARVSVLGEVGKPKSIAFRAGMRLTQALADAGGLTHSADKADVRILRGGYANPKIFVCNAKDLFAGRRPDVTLAAGDVVFVSEHWFSSVSEVLDTLIPAAATAVIASKL